MKIKLGRFQILAAAVVMALVAFVLRNVQLSRAFNENGILTGKGVIFFSVVTALAVALFAVYSRTLKGRKKYAAIAGQGLTELTLGCVAAILMVASGAVLLLNPVQQGDRLIAAGSVLTGICWALTAVSRRFGKKGNALLYMVPAAFYVVELVCRFRFWTRDPIIIDYCYDLFALISLMCAAFHLGSFCFEKGARRLTVFFSLCGLFFSAAAMVRASASDVLGYVAAMIWLLSCLWLLLRASNRKQEEEEIDIPEFMAEPAEAPKEEAETEKIEETTEEETEEMSDTQ